MSKRLAKIQFGEKSELELLDLVVERYRRRTAWHKSEKSLTLQGRAICRRLCAGDKDEANALFNRVAKLKPEQIQAVLTHFDTGLSQQEIDAVVEIHPILLARLLIETNREQVEAELETMVKRLPIADFIGHENQRGVAAGSLAAVIGSAGNLHTYATVQRLWKRMGLAVMPSGRQRLMRDAAQAKAHGYNPQRRSVMWNIGASILRNQSETTEKDKETKEVIGVKREAGWYRRIYDERKAYESAKNEAGDYAEQAAKRLNEANFDKTTSAYKAYSVGKLPPLHLHARSQRYIEKRFLKELWLTWRKVMEMPPAPPELVEADEKERVAA